MDGELLEWGEMGQVEAKAISLAEENWVKIAGAGITIKEVVKEVVNFVSYFACICVS